MSGPGYVRLHRGQIIVQRHDLQGVVAHLNDLARHLEAMIPDEDAMTNLMRARDFSSGMALRAEFERELDRAVLEALADRPADASYRSLTLQGYSVEQVEAAVYRLWKAGMVDAHSQRVKQVTPSTLTTKGFRELQASESPVATVRRK